MNIFQQIQRIWQMGKEVDELKAAVELMKTAVADAVAEIKKLADQVADETSSEDELQQASTDLHALADTLHKAVYPPSSATPLEPPTT